MKTIYVQRQVIGWEEFVYKVPDDFEDYKSLVGDPNWENREYLEDAVDYTGEYDIVDEYNDSLIDDDNRGTAI